MKSIIKSNWLFIGILIIQLFVLIYSFAFFKQGFHSDELYEYGFANSYDLRVLEKDNNGIGLDKRWTDSKELLNYISVEKDHKFSYSNIFKHASMNYYNPPLKLFLLHTICSFFPGVFSRWFSFLINIISFIVIQFFLYLLVKKMTNSIPAAVACIILFGFSGGCFNSMTFLRMYAMGMAFGMCFLYFSYLYIYEINKKKNIIYLVLIFLSLFCGAYTLHLFLVFAFPIVLIVCLGYLLTKRIKKMLCYGFTCLGSVGLSFLAFPQTIGDTMQSVDTYSYSTSKYSNSMQFRIFTSLATLDNFGFHTSMYSNVWMKNIFAVILFFIILSIPLIVLFRKEKWFKDFLTKLREKTIKYVKTIGFKFVFLLSCLCSIFFVIYLASTRTSIYTMSIKYSARYVYIIYPLICAFSVVVFYFIFNYIISKKRLLAVILVSLALFLSSVSQLLNAQPYLMLHNTEGISLDKIENNANCYILMLSNWFVICFADKLYNTNSYYFLEYNDYSNEKNCFDKVNPNEPLYLILDCSYVITDEIREEMEDPDSLLNNVYSDVMIDERDILNHYKSLKCVDNIELVGQDVVFDRRINIYRISLKQL